MTALRVSHLSDARQMAAGINHALSRVDSLEAVATDIASATARINTFGKFAGKLVWDSTNHRMMRADGGGATDVWWVIDGSASVTPV